MSNLFLAGIAFWGGWIISGVVVRHVMKSNRITEDNPNQKTPPPSENEMKWHLVHMRDDIGSIAGVLCLTNGLLAAIVILLLLR